MTTNDPQPLPRPRRTDPAVDEIFKTAEPVRTAGDLARDGVFADLEVDAFLSDLYAMRRSDVA
jgi:hypothetical protein